MIDDWRNSPATGKLRAALGFLEKLTLTPAELDGSDVAALRRAGLSERAIIDAIYVCIGFNVIVRIADAFEFSVPPPAVFERSARYLLLFGYKLLSGTWFDSAPRELSEVVDEPVSAADSGLLHDPYGRGINLLKKAVLASHGWLAPEIREAALHFADLPGRLGEYVSAVRHRAWEITDADIAALREAGQTEDQIFELTVCAAVGAGLARLEKGLEVLRMA